MEQPYILVIEDDRFVGRTIQRCLRGEHYRVEIITNGTDGLESARAETPDLVILDVIMPGMDGYEVCREMRLEPALEKVPVLFLTAKIKSQDRLMGFNVGADDYLCKPFNLDELILRVQAILRRTIDPSRLTPVSFLPAPQPKIHLEPIFQGAVPEGEPSQRFLILGEYRLNTQTFELLTPARGKVRLTPIQYDLIYHMMTHPGESFSPTRLLNEVWDYPVGRGSPDLVRVHIKTLRERIEADPQNPIFLCTVAGRGYAIDPPVRL